MGWRDANGNPDDGCECQYFGSEICNGIDDDCNSAAADTFECVQFSTGGCTNPDSGSCAGNRQCGNTCTWGPCESPAWQCRAGDTDTTCHPTGTPCPGRRDRQADCLWDPCVETCEEPSPDCCPVGCVMSLMINDEHCGECGNDCSTSTLTPHCCDGLCRNCCEQSDCEPRCRGTSTPCAAISTEGTCETQTGCAWAASGSCGGTPGDCSTYTDSMICFDCGCLSDPDCYGTPRVCTSFSSAPACTPCGCAWTDTSICTGTAVPCGDFNENQGGCMAQAGCEWFDCTDYRCQPR